MKSINKEKLQLRLLCRISMNLNMFFNFKNPSTPRIKNLRLYQYLRKSWQV